MRLRLRACDVSLTYIKKESGPRIKPWRKPQDMDASREKLFPKLIRKDFLDNQDFNQSTACLEKPTSLKLLQNHVVISYGKAS